MILPGTGRGTGQAGGGGKRQLPRPDVIVARRLRRELSLPEVLLWQRLKGSKSGLKFRRQHPIGPYIVDFYNREAGLVIEIDGQVHDGDRDARDRTRQIFLEKNGYNVIRVIAVDVLHDPDGVAASIAALAGRPLHQPAAGLPPRSGEDQE